MPAGKGLPKRRIGRCPGQGVLHVVQLHGDHRTVDVAIDEGEQHLRAGARQVVAAPVRPRAGGGDAHPGGDLRAVVAGRVGERAGFRRAQPRKAYAHAVVAVGGQRCAFFGNDQGGLALGCGRAAAVRRHDRGLGRHGDETIAVAARFDLGGGEQPCDVGAEVVGGFVFHLQRDELAVLAVEMLREREALAGAQLAHAALAFVAQVGTLVCLHAQLRGQAGALRIGKLIRPRGFKALERGQFAAGVARGRLCCGSGQGLVVP